MSNIDSLFIKLRREKRAAFIPFFVAGDPDIETTVALIESAVANGADLIEIGVPFSDPIADGPVIQAAYHRALTNGFKVAQLFELVRRLRATGMTAPLIAMVSYSIVYKRAPKVFFADCKAAGLDGLIIPDLPAGYEGTAAADSAAAGLDLVFLCAPTTPPERRALIAERSRGFIYYMSVTGITGARMALPPDLKENVDDLRARTARPVCVGFGISAPEQAAAVGKLADGVIVGSALVRRTEDALAKGLSGKALVAHVTELAAALANGTHGQ